MSDDYLLLTILTREGTATPTAYAGNSADPVVARLAARGMNPKTQRARVLRSNIQTTTPSGKVILKPGASWEIIE